MNAARMTFSLFGPLSQNQSMIAQSMQYTPAMTSAAHGLPLSAKKNRINAFVFRVRVVSLKEDRPSVRNAGTACLLLS